MPPLPLGRSSRSRNSGSGSGRGGEGKGRHKRPRPSLPCDYDFDQWRDDPLPQRLLGAESSGGDGGDAGERTIIQSTPLSGKKRPGVIRRRREGEGEGEVGIGNRGNVIADLGNPMQGAVVAVSTPVRKKQCISVVANTPM